MRGLLWPIWSGRERGQKVATEEPLAFRVVRGGLFVAASSYFNILFGFLANLVLTRLLAPEHSGGSLPSGSNDEDNACLWYSA